MLWKSLFLIGFFLSSSVSKEPRYENNKGFGEK